MKKKLFFLGSVGLLILGLTSCWGGNSNSDSGSSLFVINVLGERFYQDAHIKGSINVPFEQLEKFVHTLDKEKAEVVLYCSNYMCSASGTAAKKLKKLGFRHVCAYEGGMADWYQLGLETNGPAQLAYLARKYVEPDQHDPEIDIITAYDLHKKINNALESGGIAKW